MDLSTPALPAPNAGVTSTGGVGGGAGGGKARPSHTKGGEGGRVAGGPSYKLREDLPS